MKNNLIRHLDHCDLLFMVQWFCLVSQVYVGQWSIFYGPANLLHVLKTIYSRKVGMLDQCHSETDIVNYILPSLSLTLKYFIIKKWRRPGVFVTLWALALVLWTLRPISASAFCRDKQIFGGIVFYKHISSFIAHDPNMWYFTDWSQNNCWKCWFYIDLGLVMSHGLVLLLGAVLCVYLPENTRKPLRKHAYSNILKISPPKTGSFPIKILILLYISAQNIDCGLAKVVLTSTHNLYFWAKIRKIMYTPVNPLLLYKSEV